MARVTLRVRFRGLRIELWDDEEYDPGMNDHNGPVCDVKTLKSKPVPLEKTDIEGGEVIFVERLRAEKKLIVAYLLPLIVADLASSGQVTVDVLSFRFDGKTAAELGVPLTFHLGGESEYDTRVRGYLNLWPVDDWTGIPYVVAEFDETNPRHVEINPLACAVGKIAYQSHPPVRPA